MTELQTQWSRWALTALIACALLAGCGQPADPTETGDPSPPGGDAEASHDPGHIDVPAAVRRNLGITFARVERRAVRLTLRLPGQFELRPEARRDYHAMVPGRVELLVKQYDRVEAGTPILRIESPEWRRMQHELSEAGSGIALAEAELEVAHATEEETRRAAELLEQRVEDLRKASVRKIELETELSRLRNQLARQRAELKAREISVSAAKNHESVTMTVAAAVTHRTTADLRETVETQEGPIPRWQAISKIEVLAEAGGIVDSLMVTQGTWVGTGEELIVTVDPSLVRFRAQALQGDVGKLQDGQDAQIVPPQGGSIDMQDTIDCKIRIGFRGKPDQRTLPIIAALSELPAWGRPGVTGFLEIFISGSASPELAIPRSCVIRDGLRDVFFRRDPENPDAVDRLVADLGANDGRWIVIESGVREGDEVVLAGAYELKLASSASAAQGGHFHSDGTFHAGEDE